MTDVSKCPTCGRRYHGGRDNGGASDLRNRIEAELRKENLTQEQRVELLRIEAELQIICITNSADKRNASKKKIQYRKKRSLAEKIARSKIRTIPKEMPWSVDKEKLLEKIPNKVVPPSLEEVTKEINKNALENFFPSLKEKQHE